MSKYPYKKLGTQLDRKYRNDLNQNFEDIEHDIKDAKEAAEQLLDESFDDGVLKTNIEQRLNDLERQYEPRLTEIDGKVEQNHTQVTQQLADKADLGDVFLKQLGININDLDEETRMTFLEAQGIDVNYVLGEKNVKTINMDDRSVTTEKTDFFKSTIIPHEKLNVSLVISGSLQQLQPSPESETYRIPLRPYQKVMITVNSGDRFRVAVTNTELGEITTNRSVDKIIVNDDNLTTYYFENDALGKDLYVYGKLNINVGGNSSAEFRETFLETAYPLSVESLENKSISAEKTDFAELVQSNIHQTKSPIDYIIYYADGVATMMHSGGGAYVHEFKIEPHTTYTVKATGNNVNRFRVMVLNEEKPFVNGARYVADRIITMDDSLREVSFTNDDLGKQVFVYISTSRESDVAANLNITKKTLKFKYPIEIKGHQTETDFPIKTYELKFSTILDTAKSIGQKDEYPMMSAVVMPNYRDNVQLRPTGWLYCNSSEFLYASGKPDSLEKLCDWKEDITWNGSRKPYDYSHFVTREGDIICVVRGNHQSSEANARQNPIVYPNGDYDNPVEVDLPIKPTAWLQNSGADYVYSEDCFVFAEYTRPNHGKCYVWKVTKPFTDPNNWRIVKEFELSGSNSVGFKHCHTINYDPFSGILVLTTGDDSSAATIQISRDFGETWEVVLSGEEKYCRVLNFVFTKEKVYWATDSHYDMHLFYETTRDENGIPKFNFEDIVTLFEFPNVGNDAATYSTVLIDKPNGILFLDRADSAANSYTPFPVYFWSFEDNKAHNLGNMRSIDDMNGPFGFRCSAVNWYQATGDSRIVCGFEPTRYTNTLGVLNNTLDHPLLNVAVEVIETFR